MIKLTRKSGNNLIQVEGKNDMEVFENMASAEEVFSESKCGKCGSTEIRYKIRPATDGKKQYKYPEMVCSKCYAKLTFGQGDDGKLFPVRFQRDGKDYVLDENGRRQPKGANGWVKYNRETKQEE